MGSYCSLDQQGILPIRASSERALAPFQDIFAAGLYVVLFLCIGSPRLLTRSSLPFMVKLTGCQKKAIIGITANSNLFIRPVYVHVHHFPEPAPMLGVSCGGGDGNALVSVAGAGDDVDGSDSGDELSLVVEVFSSPGEFPLLWVSSTLDTSSSLETSSSPVSVVALLSSSCSPSTLLSLSIAQGLTNGALIKSPT